MDVARKKQSEQSGWKPAGANQPGVYILEVPEDPPPPDYADSKKLRRLRRAVAETIAALKNEHAAGSSIPNQGTE